MALLAIGMVLGALLFGSTDIVQGQDLAEYFTVAVPSSPCNLAIQSRIVTAEDGTAMASLIALPQAPPSPCTSLNLEIVSFPDDSTHCMESAVRGRVTKVDCEFDADHISTDFNFNSNARD